MTVCGVDWETVKHKDGLFAGKLLFAFHVIPRSGGLKMAFCQLFCTVVYPCKRDYSQLSCTTMLTYWQSRITDQSPLPSFGEVLAPPFT